MLEKIGDNGFTEKLESGGVVIFPAVLLSVAFLGQYYYLSADYCPNYTDKKAGGMVGMRKEGLSASSLRVLGWRYSFKVVKLRHPMDTCTYNRVVSRKEKTTAYYYDYGKDICVPF